MEYETVIGLEVHVELNTKTKIFCNCSTKFGAPPNTNVCPVCIGLPGVLPVLNENVLKKAITAALTLNCKIADYVSSDRDKIKINLTKSGSRTIASAKDGSITEIVFGANAFEHSKNYAKYIIAHELKHTEQFNKFYKTHKFPSVKKAGEFWESWEGVKVGAEHEIGAIKWPYDPKVKIIDYNQLEPIKKLPIHFKYFRFCTIEK